MGRRVKPGRLQIKRRFLLALESRSRYMSRLPLTRSVRKGGATMKVVTGALWVSALAVLLGCNTAAWAHEGHEHEEEPPLVVKYPPPEEPGEEPTDEECPVDEKTCDWPPAWDPEFTGDPENPDDPRIYYTMMDNFRGDVHDNPEPATLILASLGGASLLGWCAWRRRKV
jgi:hypothetical protein